MNNCNGTTHVVCSNRLRANGGKSQCCMCVAHEFCNLNEPRKCDETCLHTIEEGHPLTATEIIADFNRTTRDRYRRHYTKTLEFIRDATKVGSWSKSECRSRLMELLTEMNQMGYDEGYNKRQEEIEETGEAILKVWREGNITKL